MTIEEAIETIQYASAFNSDNSPLTESLEMAITALRAQQDVERNNPLTQTQLRTMGGEMVYCLELNMEVKVIASCRGLISIYYEMPGSNGTFYAKDVTLYRTNPSKG